MTITKKHIHVGPAEVHDASSSTFSLFGVGASLHLRFGLSIFRRPPASLLHVLISTSSSVFLSTWPNHLSIASVIFSFMFATSALALKVPDTNLIYPGIIGQQASGFEVRRTSLWHNRYFHVQHKWRDAISDKQVNTEKQSRSWSHRTICTKNNHCHQWWFSHTVCGSLAIEQCNTSLTTLSRMFWAKRKMGAYTWWLTLRQVRRLHHQRNHWHITGVGSKRTSSTVTTIASSTLKSGTVSRELHE